MKKEPILIMDYRYDEGCRPRRDNCCPALNTHQRGGGGISAEPLIVELWTWSDTELNRQPNKDSLKSMGGANRHELSNK